MVINAGRYVYNKCYNLSTTTLNCEILKIGVDHLSKLQEKKVGNLNQNQWENGLKNVLYFLFYFSIHITEELGDILVFPLLKNWNAFFQIM